MTKSGLVSRLAVRNSHLVQHEVKRVVSIILEEMANALVRVDRVELHGFGAFALRRRRTRTGRNPRTGTTVHVRTKFVQLFRTGRELRSLHNHAERN